MWGVLLSHCCFVSFYMFYMFYRWLNSVAQSCKSEWISWRNLTARTPSVFAGNLVLTDIRQNDNLFASLNNKAAIMAWLNTMENFRSATTECKCFSVRAQSTKLPSSPECLIKYPVNLKVNSSVKGFSTSCQLAQPQVENVCSGYRILLLVF